MPKDGALSGQALQDYKNAWNVQNGVNGERAGISVVPYGGSSGSSGSVGSSGSSMGSAASQSNALRFSNPGDVSATTPVNPMQQTAYDRANQYEQGVATGTNEETTRELGRFRDEISVGMKREGDAAMGRGADPSLFRSRALAGGQRDLTNLQARLADVSLGRREGAIGLLGARADAAAGEQRMMHLGTMSQSLAEQRALGEQAETQARLTEAPYDRLLKTLGTVASARNDLVLGGAATGGFLPAASSTPARTSAATPAYSPVLAQRPFNAPSNWTPTPSYGVMQG